MFTQALTFTYGTLHSNSITSRKPQSQKVEQLQAYRPISCAANLSGPHIHPPETDSVVKADKRIAPPGAVWCSPAMRADP